MIATAALSFVRVLAAVFARLISPATSVKNFGDLSRAKSRRPKDDGGLRLLRNLVRFQGSPANHVPHRFAAACPISLRLTANFLRGSLATLIALLCLIATPVLSASFTDNGDGTVTDPSTGLTWMRCSMGQTWTGSTCSGTAGTYTWAQANALTGTVSFATRSDWRLPNIRELQTIVDRWADIARINATAFPNTDYAYFWSASADAYQSSSTWFVYFGSGVNAVGSASNSGTLEVRLVRGGQSLGLLDAARPTSDYVDHGDGTVTHKPTGLMWKRCAEGQSWNGSTCIGSGNDFTWDAAKLLTSSFAGQNDWRMPTEDELLSLMDYTKYNPAINTVIFPGTRDSSYFWSASAVDSNNAWDVYFDLGRVYRGLTYFTYQVRLVRAGQSASTSTTTTTSTSTSTTVASTTTTTLAGGGIGGSRFTDNGDGTVTDPSTGLIWMRCTMGQTWASGTCSGTAGSYSWAQANALTGTVSFAGRSDWRLPNIRELQTIVDRSKYSPAIDAAVFPNTPYSGFWSATAYANSSSYAWWVNFGYGDVGYDGPNAANQVRLMRIGQPLALLNLARPTVDYVDHGDGTVTHTPTGLMWKRCTEGQSWDGTTCTGTESAYTWDAAKLLTSTFAGKVDWRMPTAEDLLTLVDYIGGWNPAINPTAFPSTPTSNFWSASAYAGSSVSAWSVYSGNGNANYGNNKSFTFQVRLVRAGQSSSASTTTTTLTSTSTTSSTTATPTTTTTVGSTTTTTLAGGNTANLIGGWNLLGNGLSDTISVSSVFGGSSLVTTVWKWIASSSAWAFYAPSLSDGGAAYAAGKGYESLTSIGAGEGFWVNANAPFSIQLSGNPVSSGSFKDNLTPPSPLPTGWSLIAIGDNKAPAQFVNTIAATPPAAGQAATSVTTLWAWDAALTGWYFYAPSLVNAGTQGSYISSKNYLDFDAAKKTLTPTTGFWINKP